MLGMEFSALPWSCTLVIKPHFRRTICFLCFLNVIPTQVFNSIKDSSSIKIYSDQRDVPYHDCFC